MENLTLADKVLHQQFTKIGNDRRKLTNELLALLPEIYERRIYRRYAATIVEYAGKFGGLSKNVVLKRLRLEKYLESKPLLKEAIKTEGIHKVALVASIATAETEEIWVDKLKNMSKAAIQELSKEVRGKQENGGKICAENLFGQLSEWGGGFKQNCKAVPLRLKIELDEELTGLFLKLKKKFGGNLSNAEVIKKVFEVALEDATKKTVSPAKVKEHKNVDTVNIESITSQSVKVVPGDRNSQSEFPLNSKITKPVTRYIPAKIKRHVLTKSNHQCSYPNCNKPAEIFHHTNRFATSKSHESLTTLCKIHHEFAHNGIIANENQYSDRWCLDFKNQTLGTIDFLYRTYRLQSI